MKNLQVLNIVEAFHEIEPELEDVAVPQCSAQEVRQLVPEYPMAKYSAGEPIAYRLTVFSGKKPDADCVMLVILILTSSLSTFESSFVHHFPFDKPQFT